MPNYALDNADIVRDTIFTLNNVYLPCLIINVNGIDVLIIGETSKCFARRFVRVG